jgi:hypothetical protein
MLTFAQFLVEEAEASEIKSVLSTHGHHKSVGAGSYEIQFILPDGTGIELDGGEVHARAAHMAAKKNNMDFSLIDVLRAGIVRAASIDRYQVCSPITSAQAQFMVDRVMFAKYTELTVSVADAEYAERYKDESNGAGPTEINDATYKTFDIDRVKAAGIRAWVGANV